MIFNVRTWLAKHPLGHWGKETDEEMAAVIEDIAGANLVRNSSQPAALGGDNAGANYRHYVNRGHLVICDSHVKDTQSAHPMDAPGTIPAQPRPSITENAPDGAVSAVAPEPGIFTAK